MLLNRSCIRYKNWPPIGHNLYSLSPTTALSNVVCHLCPIDFFWRNNYCCISPPNYMHCEKLQKSKQPHCALFVLDDLRFPFFDDLLMGCTNLRFLSLGSGWIYQSQSTIRAKFDYIKCSFKLLESIKIAKLHLQWK